MWDGFKQVESLVKWIASSDYVLLAMTLAEVSRASPPRHKWYMTYYVQGIKGGKFEMNRSQCPVAKILMYKIVHEFSLLNVLKAGNFASEPQEQTLLMLLKAENFASEPREPTKAHECTQWYMTCR
jgi:hypothetical protein